MAQRRPQIVVDVRFLQVSGIGTYLRSLLPGVISRIPEARWELLVRSPDREAARALGAVFLREMDARPLSIREQGAVPARLLPRTDLLWVPHINVPVLAPLVARALAVTLHDLLILEPRLASPVQRLYARTVLPVVERFADPIFCVSAATRDRWRAAYPRSARPHVTPNGVAPEWFEPPTAPLPPVLGSAAAPPYVLFAGNLKPHKNLVRLLGAFAKIQDRVPHRLVLAGNLEGLRTVDREALARIVAAGERVLRLGYLEPPVLKTVMAHADAFVFPSRYEGFGLPPLEAMAVGVPVAAARIPSVQEACGEAAHWFDPLDVDDMAARLLEVLRDEDLRARLRQRGRARAEQMGWDRPALAVARALRRRLGLAGEGAP